MQVEYVPVYIMYLLFSTSGPEAIRDMHRQQLESHMLLSKMADRCLSIVPLRLKGVGTRDWRAKVD